MAKRSGATQVEDLQNAFEENVLPGGFTARGTTEGGQVIEAPVGRINETFKSTPGLARNPAYESSLMSIRMRHAATGIQPATILNFLPIPLVVNSVAQGVKDVRIPPAPTKAEGTDDFSFHVWHEPSIEVAYRGEGINQPVDFLPIQVAKAFVDEYANFGGVVMFRGLPTAETLAQPEIVEMIDVARTRMHTWMLSKIEEANGEWNSPNRQGSKNIVGLHRQCALQMKDLGLIDELPEWVTEARSLKDVAKKCPICQTLPNPGALECQSCRYAFDPAGLYLKGTITEEDASLERLTRKEVEDLGISAYVAETIDEKPARLKRGDPKPVSIAAMRAMQAQAAGPAEVAAI